MVHDLRFAVRMIGSHRWFSFAVVLTLALGIGINTTVFTLVNAVLFKPVPIPGGERLVSVSQRIPTRPNQRTGIALLDYRDYREQNRTFTGLEAFSGTEAVIGEPGVPPERYQAALVSTGLFDLIRTPVVLGRGFTEADGQAGAPPVVLLSHSVWQKRYGGSTDVIGRVVRLSGTPTTIIGVMPQGCKFPNLEELWMPLVPTEQRLDRKHRGLQLFGLLKPGVSLDAARADLEVIAARLASAYPETNKDYLPLIRTFHETYNGDQIRLVFLMMLGAVGFVLLIACANVANLLLSRAVGRSREISIRAALGASRRRLIRQLLLESVLLSCLGGLLGLGLSVLGVHLFDVSTTDVGRPYWIQFEMDWVAFGYFAALSIGSGLVFGLAPAVRASRVDLTTALKDGAPSGGSGRSSRLTAALIIGQFALTMVLMTGAGLMMRNFFAIQSMNAFVPAGKLFTAHLSLPDGKGERYESVQARRLFHDQLLARISALPGVTHAAIGSHLPGLGAAVRDIEIEGHPTESGQPALRASANFQSPDYFSAIGLPLLAGRGFAGNDGEEGKEVAVVTRAFAARHGSVIDAIGRRFRFLEAGKPGPWITVVGVCGDLIQDTREQEAPPLVILSHRQEPWGWLSFLVRSQTDASVMAGSVRAAVQALDQDLPLLDAHSLSAAMERQHWFLAVFGTLFLVFAAMALLMSSVGIYAVVAQSTSRRTREIGIRMALGSTTAGIAWLVVSRGLWQLLLGLALGLGGALATVRLLKTVGFLNLVSSTDPLVFASVSGLLLVIGLLACWIPARRASIVDPTQALRID